VLGSSSSRPCSAARRGRARQLVEAVLGHALDFLNAKDQNEVVFARREVPGKSASQFNTDFGDLHLT
jgi:hypothetical protein